MEAIAALSVAAAAIQFVDFGGKVLSRCREIRNSAKGTTKANEEIEASIEGLKEIQKLFKPITITQGVPQQDVDIIERARQDFDNAANDLLKQLQDLKRSRSKWLWGDMKATHRAYKARKKIESLVKRSESRNERFQVALSADTRNRVLQSLEEQKKIKDVIENSLVPKVENLRTESEALHSTTRTDISSARKEFAAAHGELGVKLTTVAQNQEASGRQIEGQLEEARTTAAQRDFLASLAFPDMSSRYEKIGPAAPGTFGWIFEEERLPADDASDEDGRKQELRGKFRRWLINDESVFWISGKPGSGKSSLMHFIENDERLERHLKQWSGGRSLTILQFFFWRPGSDLQKSIAGMLRSLLHQSLRRKPLLIDEICAQNPGLRHSDWSQDRLASALKAVLTLHHLDNDCVFILIDGLDELEGDHLGLLSVICQIKRMESTKVCLSSRPDPVFRSQLHAYPTIRLEDLNFRDIKGFVTSKLAVINYPYLEHTDTIAHHAQGIFLWAALVSKDVVRGSLTADDEITLQNRIDGVPQGLKPLFASLFSGIDKHHQDFLVFIFQILKIRQGSSVNIALITACLHHTHVKSVREFLELCREVQQQITLRSMGLIEVNASSSSRLAYGWALEDSVTKSNPGTALEDEVLRSWHDLAWPDVHWMHRSAYDYIFESPEADLPCWVGKIDITQDLIGGAAWLFRYGLVTGIYPDMTVANWQCVDELAYIIGQTVQSHSHGATNPVYRTLDELCRVVQISLSEGSPLDLDLRQRFSIPTASPHSQLYQMNNDFWFALLEAGLHDYIISRFDILKSGRFAHPTCGGLLGTGWKTLRAPLMGLILDFLLAQTNSKKDDVFRSPKKAQGYSLSIQGWPKSLSWLSHGKLIESETIEALHYAWLSLFETTEAAKNTRVQELDFTFADAIAKMEILTEKWQIFSGRSPTWGKTWPLVVHLSLSNTINRNCTDRGDENGIRLRLLGFKKSPETFDFGEEGSLLAPVSVFHPSQATCITLNAFLELISESHDLPHRFEGIQDKYMYSKCRDVLIQDIQEDTNAQLDAWQQLYLLACVRTRFHSFWRLKIPGGQDGVSDRSLCEPRAIDAVSDESKNES